MEKYDPLTVFSQGQNGYNTFRIPALLAIENIFLAFCEARKNSFRDWGPMNMVMRRGFIHHSAQSRVDWEELQVIASFEGFRTMNPVPILDKQRNVILLVFTALPTDKNEAELSKSDNCNQKLYVIKSSDLGQTWSKPKNITDSTLSSKPWSTYAPGPGHGIQLLTSGRLVVPGNFRIRKKINNGWWWERMMTRVQSFYDPLSQAICQSNVLYSDDGGENWKFGGSVPHGLDSNKNPLPSNESQVVELDDGTLCLNCRTTTPLGLRQQSFSDDHGISFTPGKPVQELIEPKKLGRWHPSVKNFGGCQGSILGFPVLSTSGSGKSGTWAVFSNPAWDNQRCNLSVRISKDNCQSWSRAWCLHEGPSAYSDLAYLGPGKNNDWARFACLYEAGSSSAYEKIVLHQFTIPLK